MGGIKHQDQQTVRGSAGGDVRAMGVVKLYLAKPDPNSWTDSGIMGGAAFVAAQNTHYIRIIDLSTSDIVFEQEWYQGFQYSASTGFFHTIELSDCVGGLCFSDPGDGSNFATAVASVSGSHDRAPPPRPPMNPTPHTPSNPTPSPTNHTASVQVTSTPTTVSSSPQRASSGSNIATPAPAKKKTEKVGFFGRIKNKLKGDTGPDPNTFVLSGPTGFRHDSHIGWDPEHGFEIRNIPPAWRKLFQQAGVKKSELQDAETAKFIMDTIATSVMGENPTAAPMQAPSHGGGGPPPPPPPAGGPPPPPPPPPPPGAPPPPVAVAPGGGGGGRANLLADIQKGKELRAVEAGGLPEIDSMSEEGRGNLANTLANALALRRADMVASDHEEDDGGWDEWDENM